MLAHLLAAWVVRHEVCGFCNFSFLFEKPEKTGFFRFFPVCKQHTCKVRVLVAGCRASGASPTSCARTLTLHVCTHYRQRTNNCSLFERMLAYRDWKKREAFRISRFTSAGTNALKHFVSTKKAREVRTKKIVLSTIRRNAVRSYLHVFCKWARKKCKNTELWDSRQILQGWQDWVIIGNFHH